MLEKVLIVVVAAVVLFEVVEHVVVPLAAVLRGRRWPVGGAAAVVGAVVEVTRWDGDSGQVRLGAEYWSAECERPLAPGDRAVVQAVRGVTLTVRPNTLPEAVRGE